MWWQMNSVQHTILKASRPHKKLPKHPSETGFCDRIKNRYHWNSSNNSLISLNALAKRWPSSHVMKTTTKVLHTSKSNNNPIKWFPWCALKWLDESQFRLEKSGKYTLFLFLHLFIIIIEVKFEHFKNSDSIFFIDFQIVLTDLGSCGNCSIVTSASFKKSILYQSVYTNCSKSKKIFKNQMISIP